MADNFFDRFDGHAQTSSGFIPLTGPKPGQQYQGPMAAAQLAHEQAIANNAPAMTQAQYQHQQLENVRLRQETTKAQQEADDAAAARSASAMSANSQLHGDAYLKAAVPPEQWSTIKALARGDLGSRTGISKTLLPLLQHAMNYDPSMSGSSFPARVSMQQQLTKGDPGSIGGAVRSMEQMLLHGGEVLDQASGLNNFHSGVGAPLNYPKLAWEKWQNDPRLAGFNKSVENYAPESQKAIAGTAGGVAERQDRAASFSGASSPEAVASGLQSDARMAMDRIGAVNDQYRRVMGRDITDVLSPAAKAAYDKIMAGGYGPDGKPLHPVAGWTPISSPTDTPGSNIPGAGSGGGNRGGPSGTPPGLTIATGATKQAPLTDQELSRQRAVEEMLRAGLSYDTINTAAMGMGSGPLDRAQVTQATQFLRDHPDYQGQVALATHPAPTTLLNRVAGSPEAAFFDSALDQTTGGFSDEAAGGIKALISGKPFGQTVTDLNAKKQTFFGEHSLASGLGNVAGSIAGTYGVGKLLGAAGLAGKALPYASAAGFGAISGAGQNNDDRFTGGLIGAGAGAAGTYAGNLLAAPVGALLRTGPVQAAASAAGNVLPKKLGGMMFQGIPSPVSAPSAAESAAMQAITRSDPAAVTGQLARAGQLGVPMTLADTHPELRELAAAAVRRSPTASAYAENALMPRSYGQIDRFGQAITRDLGPIANIPQTSADLTAQARSAAAPLYDAAYKAPGASSVNLDDLAQRPSMKAGLQKAYSIAQEEGRDPTSLGFNLTGQGDVTLGRVPSFQTLDYVKRGLDETLEPHRNPITGQLDLNETTRAINGTKAELLNRMDAANPDYAAARQAYAGPVQARDALARGQAAVNMDPNSLGVQVANQTPEQLAQMQAGYRGGLMDAANRVRYSSNPFDLTLGSPAAEQRLSTMYPNSPGTQRLMEQRDMERGLAQTSNAILGNSRTAQRQIADKAFNGGDLASQAADVGINLLTGQVPTGPLLRGLTSQRLKDAWQFGVGQRAIAKADDLAPMLLNPDPQANSQLLYDLTSQGDAYRDYLARTTPRRLGRMFGAGVGVSASQGF